MCNAWRYSQHVPQSPGDCEGCVTMCITNFTAKTLTWPRVEEINREAVIFERGGKVNLCRKMKMGYNSKRQIFKL